MRRFQVVSARTALLIIALLVMFSASACGSAPTPELANTSEPTQEATTNSEIAAEEFSGISEEEFEDLLDLDPNNFDNPTNIDNEWWPLRPGTQFVYEGFTIEGEERVSHRLVITVTDLTKVINGVRSVVVYEKDYDNDLLVEQELAFFVQDNDGNVWHLGQYREVYDAKEFVGGRVFLVGHLEGARAGIMVPGQQRLGTPSYSQGYGPPPFNWTDRARVYQMGQQAVVSSGSYENVLVIEEYNQEEPGAFQLKYYAPGVGVVRVGWRGDDPTQEEMELVEMVQLDPEALAQVRAEALEMEKRAYVYGQTPPLEQNPAAFSSPETSPTPQASPTPEQPLLTGQTTMCDLGANLINFRMVEPVPDLTDKTMMVEIVDIETTCAVNPTNPSLLTCTIPPLVTFPVRVVVSLDGAIMNDFTYEGIGCDE